MKGPNKKSIIIFVVVAVLAIFIYGYFFKKDSNTSDRALVSSVAQNSVNQQNIIGRELLASLNQLRSLILDTSIFNEQSFKSLQSFNVELQPEITGRTNPFLPINAVERKLASTTRR